jgi:hypothetical protein
LQRQQEDLVASTAVTIKVYQQKVKDLLHSHKQEGTRLKAAHEAALIAEQEQQRRREGALKRDKRALKLERKELDLSHQDALKALRSEHERELTMMRQQYELQARELHASHEARHRSLRSELELRRRTELHEVEERKNAHISSLLLQHERQYASMKQYYNDITHNNLDLIKALKEELAELTKRGAASEKLMWEIAQENKRLSEPLQTALREVGALRAQLGDYDRDRQSLSLAKGRVDALEVQLRSVSWEHGLLEERFGAVERERDELATRFEVAVEQVEERHAATQLLLERQLQAASDEAERARAQVSEVLSAAGLDPAVLGAARDRVDSLLEAKNRALRDSRFELARVVSLHNSAVATFTAKLAEFGVPAEDLAFRPLEVAERPTEQFAG